MRKNKAGFYAKADNSTVVIAALLAKYNVRAEVYCIGHPSAFYKTKDLDEAISAYAKEHKFSKVIATCWKCYGHIAEQDKLPEQEHTYQCSRCGHQKEINKV